MIDQQRSVKERRKRRRYGINAPLTVFAGRREIPGFTQNVSNTGVYFFADLAEMSPISGDFEFLISLPPEITLSSCCLIRCRGRVVRTDQASTQLTGIGARILEYSIEKEQGPSV